MLKIIENLSQNTASQLVDFFGESLSGVFALFSMLDWINVDGAWIQTENDEVTALVVQKEMCKVYVSANEKSDYYELADFISRLGGMVVHCPPEITAKIGVTAFSKHSVMALDKQPEKVGRGAVEINDNLRAVFDLLIQSKQNILNENGVAQKEARKYTDRAYKEWLSKTSRGIFGGYTSVRAVKAGENSILSVAVADRLGKMIYLRDVATDRDFRKMGYATDCVAGICRDFRKENETVFLVCDDVKTENFYKKIGFERKDYLELGIVEI